ncbi:hypothetical protein BCR34DRAFT_482839 [Clohesyomyces aquaticus]|uniref:Uncharacterized protein n=1 Tax=Clohesyomyces aquaticus TaxID=1231657 RepID=A0A1Y1ZQ22_9PLEO|nr:hypothetical protein BCR34DRAFT_482839 [Clohesyomyces aquaticus]
MKNPIQSILAKHRFRTFNCMYFDTYKTLAYQNVANDTQHPLYGVQKRIQAGRDRSGLWWMITAGNNSTKTKVVRSWLRRRLKTAFIEELKKRGFDRDGKLLDVKKRNLSPGDLVEDLVKIGKTPELKGSLKLHVLAPLITAKGEEVKTEAGKVVDALCSKLRAELASTSQPGQVQKPTKRSHGTERMHWGRLPERPPPAAMCT